MSTWKRRFSLLSVLVVFAVSFSGCQKSKPAIVCTTGMVADIVRNVVGDEFEVVQLMGDGVDPHLYKPAPGDMKALSAAYLIVYSGLHLEANMQRIFEKMEEQAKAKQKETGEELPPKTVAVTQKLHDSHDSRLIKLSEEGDLHDPHVWMNVALWSECVSPVEEALSKIRPSKSADFKAAAEKYKKQLLELQEECKELIQTIPEEQRFLVTAHDAFEYFGAEYNIKVKAVQGVSTQSEASVNKVSELVKFLSEKKIPAVFVESSVNEKNILAIIDGCKASGHNLKLGGTLYSDAMGASGSGSETYIGMIRHNVTTIVEALK